MTYKEETTSLMQPGWYCTACGEVVFVGEDLVVRQQAFTELKVRVDDILSPREVERIRKKLGVSQRAAGALLGGGPRAFQKYESGSDWHVPADGEPPAPPRQRPRPSRGVARCHPEAYQGTSDAV